MATNMRPLIRVSKNAYDTLKVVSKQMGKPMTQVAEEAIQHYSDKRFWDEVDRAYESWTPEQKRDYHKDFRGWEAFAGQTLPAEDWSDEWRAQQRARATTRRPVVDGSRSNSRARAGRSKASGRRVR